MDKLLILEAGDVDPQHFGYLVGGYRLTSSPPTIMKILLVNDYGYAAGGAEVILFSLRDALKARGHDVRVFSSSAWDGSGSIEADYLCQGTLEKPRTHLQCMNWEAARALRFLLGEFQPDVVHVNLYLTQLSPFILRSLRHVPSLYYAQWYRIICPLGTRRLPTGENCHNSVGLSCLTHGCIPRHYWPPLMGQMLANDLYSRNFSKICAISQAVANRLAEHGGQPLRNAVVVPPGTATATPRLEVEMTRAPTVVVASRLVADKGVDVLVEAFARVTANHPGSRLEVIGDGPRFRELQELAMTIGVEAQIRFHGHLSHSQTLALVRTSWVVCVPSLWEEPFGMIAAEAQMHGVAVVASHVGGLSDIVDQGETGWLVPPGDVEALAHRLDLLMTDQAAALSMGLRGHVRAHRLFSVEAFVSRFEALYQELIQTNRHPYRK